MKNLSLLILVLAVVGCEHEDRAKPDYERCLKLEPIDPKAAYAACRSAFDADWQSPSGKAAIEKARALEDKIKLAERAEAADRPRLVAEAKKKVDRHFYNHDRDGECVDKGLPAYRWSYE